MNPNNPDVTIDEDKQPKVIITVCNKGTQTIDESENSSYRSLTSKATSACRSDDVSVNIFECNTIVQDEKNPDQIAIIRNTLSKEIVEHSNGKLEDTSSRYTYCREVIRPFLTGFSPDRQCSDDELIKEVIKAVQEDFPDYQPCFDSSTCSKKNNTESTSTKTPVCTETFMVDKVKAQSPSGSKSSFFPVTLCPSKPTPDKSDPKDKGKPSLERKKPDEYDDPYDPCSKPKCVRKAVCPEEIKPCKKPKAEPRTPPPPFCADDSGPHCTQKLQTGCETAEDLKELEKERRKSCGKSPGGSNTNLLPPPSFPPKQKTVLEAHCEAFDTVKQACAVALGAVYDKTRETVTLIRTESAKQLEKIRAPSRECEDTCDRPKSPPPSPKDKDPCAREVSNAASNKNIVIEKLELDRLETLNAEDLLHKMVEKMESTISMISEHIDFDTIAEILKSDNKNVYDKPTTPPQKLKLKTSHHSPDEHPNIQDSIHDSIHEIIHSNMNTANNMFTAIKSKIFSIFSDITQGTEKAEEHPRNQEDPENEDNTENN